MSQRRIRYVPMVLLLVIASGCVGYRPIDGVPPEDIKKSEASQNDLQDKADALAREQAAYQKQIADQQAEIAAMNKALADQQAEFAQAQKRTSELNRTVDELTTQIKQLHDARQKASPLQVTELVPVKPVKKEPIKPDNPAKVAAKDEPKESPPAKARAPKSTAEAIALTKQLSHAKRKKTSPQASAPVHPKKGTEAAEGRTIERKEVEQKKEAAEIKPSESSKIAEIKPSESRSVDDLSAQMKAFEEARPKTIAPKDAGPVQAKKAQAKPATISKEQKKVARKEPPETKVQDPKAIKIKVLAGDGNIASAGKMSKQLGKMGYRVRASDLAPRSDFSATTVYYGADHRLTAEAMAKALGGGTVTKPLNWSSTFDIIVVTGHRR